MNSIDDLKQNNNEEYVSSLKKNIGLSILGGALVATGIVGACRIPKYENKIAVMQADFVKNVAELSPEFNKDLENYKNYVDTLYTTGEVDKKEYEEKLSPEVLYNKALDQDVVYSDKELRHKKNDISSEKSLLRDQKITKNLGMFVGIPLTLVSSAYVALELYVKRKLKQEKEQEDSMNK